MSSNKPQNVAIIGAGLAGLGLALGLHSHGIPCTIYEQSSEFGRFGGAIMLSPNALRLLDAYGVYERIRVQGWNFDSCAVKNEAGETTDLYFMGSEKLFGYQALRIYRKDFVKELELIVKERGIQIHYETKFSHVVSESNESVTFAFSDGRQATATLLCGTDGIHSRLRSYIAPDVQPVYIGLLAVVGAVKRSKLTIPPNEPIDGPLMYSAKPGTFIIAPQDLDGGELMAGTQRRHPAQDREGWAKLAADKDALRAFLTQDLNEWPEIIQSAIEGIDMDSVYIWPMHALPHLPSWTSAHQRVILLGDAAHPIPPTAGQGANQAFEDGFTLSLLLSHVSAKTSRSDALRYWQDMRQRRVDQVSELTGKLNNMRLPAVEKETLAADEVWRDEDHARGEGRQMEWLFVPRLEEEVMKWVHEREDA